MDSPDNYMSKVSAISHGFPWRLYTQKLKDIHEDIHIANSVHCATWYSV